MGLVNVDEMGLFYKALPSKILTYKGEMCSGEKRSKERITMLVGANMDSCEKLKSIVVGKWKHPRSFKGTQQLPVSYYAKSKAWMTRTIFENWLKEDDAKCARQKRNAVFIVENSPVHSHVIGLKSITIKFLAANTTAVIQPMDQGVIQNLKVLYSRQLLHRMLLCAGNNKDYCMNLLSAFLILTHAW
ncbi:tigger transposable element-derived protein 4-like [Ornithodoros turicata]|uniref:tigger transposable element-derived protein 4-like n=1 Tax=Ornithodoros turicata TaxID=34597 RepID=UPI00313A3C85